MHVATCSMPKGGERLEYRVRLDPLVHRQIVGWKLYEGLLVDVHMRLNEELPQSPRSVLQKESRELFENEGMLYRFQLIDPENRMLVHDFIFKIKYRSDEQTLLVVRRAHKTSEGV